jgi:hypothetical protein
MKKANNVYKYTRKLQHGHKAKLERQLIEFMIGLQDAVKDHIPKVPLQTKHTRCGETFRAHTWFRGAIWRDWVYIDWGDDGGELPSKISGFVDLSETTGGCRYFIRRSSTTFTRCVCNCGVSEVLEKQTFD